MYKLLIVDDDEMERRGIGALPIFQGAQIQVAGEAWNGSEALELCESLRPDIVLSDVRMPVMDGLSFVSKLKALRPETKVIMMSGFEDFEAIKLAMSIGAEAYLTKPIPIDELQRALRQVAGALDLERDRTDERRRLHERVARLTPVLRERLLRDLMLGVRDLSDEYTRQEVRSLDGFALDGKLAVLAVQVHAQSLDHADRQRQFAIALGKLESMYASGSDMLPIAVHGGLYALLAALPPGLDDETAFDYLHQCAEAAFSQLHNELGAAPTIAVSGIGGGATELPLLYTQALSALQKQALYSACRIYWYEHTRENGPLPDVSATARLIERLMIAGDPHSLSRTLDAFFDQMRAANASLENIHILCVELLFRYAILAHEDGKDFLSAFEGRQIPYQAIMEMQSAREMKPYMLEIFSAAQQSLYVRPSSQAEQIAQRVREIIAEQYAQPISTEMIAREVFLTPSHLRRVFKNLTGQTIQDYILATRMSRARALLLDTQMKVFEIAHAVGYENQSYFNIVFKKYFGKAPGEYRHELS